MVRNDDIGSSFTEDVEGGKIYHRKFDCDATKGGWDQWTSTFVPRPESVAGVLDAAFREIEVLKGTLTRQDALLKMIKESKGG
ncbi:hypothetical protein LCGC14_2587440, partial [marine sediment metagenome]